MIVFKNKLAKLASKTTAKRKWVYAPYDQLSDSIGPLAETPPNELGIILIESSWKAARRPYHKQKLALILANMRHFALEQAARGVAVDYISTDKPYDEALREAADRRGSVLVQEPAERELRHLLAPLVLEGLLAQVPHGGWMTTRDDFSASISSRKTWRMDAFYRVVRNRTGILMKGGKPEGGKYSFDPENRLSWKGEPVAPEPQRFTPDAVTEEVIAFVENKFAAHPGRIDPNNLPASRGDAESAWEWAKANCLAHFGPFEDAMSLQSQSLFHTKISHLLNICRLLPKQVVEDVENMKIPLPCREGFIRQVMGWREFVRHVHVETDGFRNIRGKTITSSSSPGDGGFGDWEEKEWSPSESEKLDGGARPDHLEQGVPVPAAYWGQESGLLCLDQVVREVWDSAYGHHITRLMVLSNLAALLDLDPRALTDWFWVAYTDAYDWVVEPNVLGMGTFATGELMTTKPYVSGTPYINKMSDYCPTCSFHPKKNCPVSNLYWAYLERHKEKFGGIFRLNMPLRTLSKRSPEKKRQDKQIFEWISDSLANGKALSPDDIPSAD